MDIDEALEIRGGGIPRGGAVLVTDEVDASGGWLIAHLLKRALVSAAAGSDADADVLRRATGSGAGSVERRFPKRRVCMVTAEYPASHYTKTLAKLGRDARGDLSSGRLVVVDLLSRPFPSLEASTTSTETSSIDHGASTIDKDLANAQTLFANILHALDGDQSDTDPTTEIENEDDELNDDVNNDARRVVVLDDIYSCLVSVSVPSRSLSVAVDALLRSICGISDCAVVFGAHLDCAGRIESQSGGWLEAATGVCDLRLDVCALKTGVAEDVHGRVRVTHRNGRFARVINSSTSPVRRAVAKYRLAETGIHAQRERLATG